MRGMRDEQLEIAGAPSTARLSLYWAPVVVYAALVFYLSSLSHPEDLAPPLFELLSDTVLHAVEYGILGGLCYRAFRYAARSLGRLLRDSSGHCRRDDIRSDR